jgi:pantoate--beta-alanine ligase
MMRTIRTVAELRAALLPDRRAGRMIGLVPTMGALHDGHLSLIRRARDECDRVAVSLFVNPAQFNDAGDLASYPRSEERDSELAGAAGADYLFAPAVEEVYPADFATTVVVAGITEGLEGTERGRAHFDGVATVVTKLLNMVGPDVAYFGQKDAQQAAVIRRVVRDLDIPVRIAVCPTIRDADGLALSSRNALLDPCARRRASELHRALRAVQEAVLNGAPSAEVAIAAGREQLIAADIAPEYFTLADPETLRPVSVVDRPALALVAARIGGVRLIDNLAVQPAMPPQPCPAPPIPHEVATPSWGANQPEEAM